MEIAEEDMEVQEETVSEMLRKENMGSILVFLERYFL